MPTSDTDALWRPGPGDRSLPGDEVHVWRAALDLPAPAVAGFRSQLAADELERAGRYHFEHDRRHFIAGRGILRTILGTYLDTPPEQFRFRYNPYGKPGLSDHPDQDPIRFNVAHSQGLALYAVTIGRRIGVDVEQIRQDLAV